MRIASLEVTASEDGTDHTADMAAFAQIIGLEPLVTGRYSLLFFRALLGGAMTGRLNPATVVREVRFLESQGPSSTKPAARFKGPILKGLWHKHYFSGGLAALAINLKNALSQHGLPSLEPFQQRGEAIPLAEMIDAILYDAGAGNFKRKQRAGTLTGEWIVFAKHEDKNYYLALWEHTVGNKAQKMAGDKALRAVIDEICAVEFPFLVAALGNV